MEPSPGPQAFGGVCSYGRLISPVLDTNMLNILLDHFRKETLPALL